MTTAQAFLSTLTSHPVLAEAVAEIAGSILDNPLSQDSLTSSQLLITSSPCPPSELEWKCRTIAQLLGIEEVYGFTSMAPVGIRQFNETTDGLSAILIPKNTLSIEYVPGTDKDTRSITEHIHAISPDHDIFILADPSLQSSRWCLSHTGNEHSKRTINGVFLSGKYQDAGTIFFANSTASIGGALILKALDGRRLLPFLSSGVRAIGTRYTLTSSEDKTIRSIASASPLDTISQLVRSELDNEDIDAIGEGRLVVCTTHEEFDSQAHRLQRSIYRIENVDSAKGWMHLSGNVETGSTIEFAIRDARVAELELLRIRKELNFGSKSPLGAIFVFPSLTRGQLLHGYSNFEPSILSDDREKISIFGTGIHSAFTCGFGSLYISEETTVVLPMTG